MNPPICQRCFPSRCMCLIPDIRGSTLAARSGECEHDYEPDTTLTIMRCEKCGEEAPRRSKPAEVPEIKRNQCKKPAEGGAREWTLKDHGDGGICALGPEMKSEEKVLVIEKSAYDALKAELEHAQRWSDKWANSARTAQDEIEKLKAERNALNTLCETLAPKNVTECIQSQGLEISQLRRELERAADAGTKWMAKAEAARAEVERLKTDCESYAILRPLYKETKDERDRFQKALERIDGMLAELMITADKQKIVLLPSGIEEFRKFIREALGIK